MNAKGAYFTVQKLAPLLRHGSGVVLTTSLANVTGQPLVSVYSATKGALRTMTRGLARELLPQGVRVNAVSPGPIDTGIIERSMPPDVAEQMKEQLSADNPMLRFGQASEVAKAVLFLAFERDLHHRCRTRCRRRRVATLRSASRAGTRVRRSSKPCRCVKRLGPNAVPRQIQGTPRHNRVSSFAVERVSEPVSKDDI